MQTQRKVRITGSDETYTSSTLGTMQISIVGEQKVLGIRWNVSSDCFILSIQDIAHLANQIEPTKRHIVSVIGRIYDPLGYLSPVVIRFKIFFQELCKSKVEWDQPYWRTAWQMEFVDLRYSRCLRNCYSQIFS